NCYTYASDTLFDIFGIDRGEHPFFTPELFWSSVHPDDAAFVRDSVHQPAHLVSSTLEYRIVRPDGKIVYINRIREVFRDADGRPVKTIGTIQDVTDRKLSELALQQREVRFRSLVQNGNDLISIVDSKGNYLFVGENVLGHLGYSAEALVGRNAFDFIHPEDVQHVRKAQQQIIEKSTVAITPVRFQDSKGEWRWVETTVSNHLNNPAIEGLVVNSKDVTEKMLKDQGRKRYEDELRKLSLIARETNNAVILQDNQRRVLWVNQAFLNLTGYQLEECIGKDIGEICDGPQTDPETIRYVQEKIDKKEPFHIVTLNYKKDGETYWADVSCQPVFDEDGKVVQYFSIATDITERKLLENQLERERHERQVNIAAATLKAQEYERTIVSQELHDNVNQVLTTVKLYVEMCRDDIGNPKEIMDKSIKLLQDSINEIRSLSKRL
ncbi:MAG: PAS domain S-box protein, partial [Chitinophagaceae bacterium]